MSPAKLLIATGIILVVIGLVLSSKTGLPLLGRLPGDIRIEKENFSFYFPLGTCILISAAASIILWFLRR